MKSDFAFLQKVKSSRYGPGLAQRVGRGIALLFHDRGTRRGWVVSSTSRPHFTPGKDSVPILQEAGWAPGPVWTGGKSRPHLDSIPDLPARSQSLYRLSYPAHFYSESSLKILKVWKFIFAWQYNRREELKYSGPYTFSKCILCDFVCCFGLGAHLLNTQT